MRRLATDITGVQTIGLDDWLREFSWPVSEDEFHKFAGFLQDAWVRACLSLEGEERELLLCENVPGWLLQLAHAAVVKERARSAGVELLHGPLSSPVYEPRWDVLGSEYGRMLAWSRSRLKWRRLLRNLAFNSRVSVFAPVRSLVRPDATALGSNDPLRERYVRGHGLAVDNTYLPLLLGDARPTGIPARLRDAAGDLLRTIREGLSRDYGVAFDADGAHAALLARLDALWSVYEAVRARRRKGPLLVTEAAKPLHKAVACAWRAAGGTAVGFLHGHAVGEMYMPERVYGEFFAYDEFACYGEQDSRAFAADYASTPLAVERQVRFTYTPQKRMGTPPDWKSTFPASVKRVMIMGFPMNGFRYPNAHGLFWPTQFEAEVRLIRLLSAAGFEVLYKVHPERAHPVSELMATQGCRVVPEPFEQVVDQADAFVMKYIGTTTFPAILCAARPVYVVDTEREVWNTSYRELLARRCVMLKGNINADGKMFFDEQALVAGLSGRQVFPDYSYFKKYYASWGTKGN